MIVLHYVAEHCDYKSAFRLNRTADPSLKGEINCGSDWKTLKMHQNPLELDVILISNKYIYTFAPLSCNNRVSGGSWCLE